MYADEVLIEQVRYFTDGALRDVCDSAIGDGIAAFQMSHVSTTVIELDDDRAVRLIVGPEVLVWQEISRAPLTKTLMGFFETEGGPASGDGLAVLTRMAGSAYVGRDHGTVSAVFVSAIVESLLDEVYKRLSTIRSEGAYVASTEILIGRLFRLLEERDALFVELTRVYDERDVALAKIDQLQLINDALQSELYRTKHRRDPRLLSQYAIAAATLLGPVAGVVVASQKSALVQSVVDSARQVEVDCGNHTIVFNP